MRVGKGRVGAKSGAEKQSMLLARAKGSCVDDRCAMHVHRLSPTYTGTNAPAQISEKAGRVSEDDEWEVSKDTISTLQE